MKLFLIRHPQTEALQKKIIYGQSESPLTPEGEASIAWVSEKLKTLDLFALYSSPQQRAKRLADGIAQHHPGIAVITDERIREMHCGIYEQMRIEELLTLDDEDAKQFLAEFGVHRPKGGENFEDVKARTASFLEDMKALSAGKDCGERPIAVVSHAMAIRSMLSHLLDYPLRDIWHFDLQPSVILEIEYGRGWQGQGFARLIAMSGPKASL